jgi:hypothetical protein
MAPGSSVPFFVCEAIAGSGRAGQLLDPYQARQSRNFLRFLTNPSRTGHPDAIAAAGRAAE